MTATERVQALCELAKRPQRCGPIYLATMLVDEAYQRECITGRIFDQGGQDEALVRITERLERVVVPLPASAPVAAVRPRKARKPRPLRTPKRKLIPLVPIEVLS